MMRRARIAVVAAAVALMPFIAIGYSRHLDNIVADNCRHDNTQDAKQVALWEFIITMSPGAKPEQVKVFRAYIRDTFAPRDCG